jgi:ribosomal protein S17E
MGKIKSKMIRKAANALTKEDLNFEKDFEKNKAILGREMPSKRLRNKIAGLISRMKTQEEKTRIAMKA